MSDGVCDMAGCNAISEYRYVFTGSQLLGDTSPAEFCETHADNHAEESNSLTGRTPLDHE